MIIACIPAYNEESTIGSVVVRAMRHVDRVVVCDDGSGDLTGEIAGGLGAVVVRHERNMGYGASLLSLFEEARRLGGDVMVTLDGDGQHDPAEIPRLVERLEAEDVDIVIGSRFLEEGGSKAPLWRKTGIKLITSLASNEELRVTDAQSGFRAYNRQALESLVLTERGMGASTEILLKAKEAGLRVFEVPINISYNYNTSTQNILFQGIDVIGSTLKHQSIQQPMRFYGVPSVICLMIGVVFGAWALQLYRIEGRLVTNLTLISIASTIMGLILLTTGIILYSVISVLRERT